MPVELVNNALLRCRSTGQGEHQAAMREYEAALERAPSHPGALFDAAVLRAEFLDQRPQSIELFQRFLAVAPGGLAQREVAERYVREITAEQNAPPPPPPSADEATGESGDEGGGEPMDL